MTPHHVHVIGRFARLAAVVLLAASCGGDDDGGTGPGSTSSAIDVRDNAYSPRTTTVPVGTTVTWTWRGSNMHDVTFSSSDHSVVQRTGTFQRRFDTAGTFDYHCSVHGSAMSGTVTVQ